MKGLFKRSGGRRSGKGAQPKLRITTPSGAFVVEFFYRQLHDEECIVRLHSVDGSIDLIMNIRNPAYAALLRLAENGGSGALENYCLLMWRLTQLTATDQGTADAVIEAVNAYDRRVLEEEAPRANAAVSDEEENAAQIFMEDVGRYSELDEKGRKEERARMRETLDEMRRSGESLTDLMESPGNVGKGAGGDENGRGADVKAEQRTDEETETDKTSKNEQKRDYKEDDE